MKDISKNRLVITFYFISDFYSVTFSSSGFVDAMVCPSLSLLFIFTSAAVAVSFESCFALVTNTGTCFFEAEKPLSEAFSDFSF
jgi:hypothetical protein